METYSTSCKLWNLSKLQKMEMFWLKGKYLTCSAALVPVYNGDCSPSFPALIKRNHRLGRLQMMWLFQTA